MSTLAELREETRQLLGPSVYDRFFLPNGSTAWVDDAMVFACNQTATLLGLTRTDVMLHPSNGQVVIPSDAVKVVFVQER